MVNWAWSVGHLSFWNYLYLERLFDLNVFIFGFCFWFFGLVWISTPKQVHYRWQQHKFRSIFTFALLCFAFPSVFDVLSDFEFQMNSVEIIYVEIIRLKRLAKRFFFLLQFNSIKWINMIAQLTVQVNLFRNNWLIPYKWWNKRERRNSMTKFVKDLNNEQIREIKIDSELNTIGWCNRNRTIGWTSRIHKMEETRTSYNWIKIFTNRQRV